MKSSQEYLIGMMLVFSFVCYIVVCSLNMDLFYDGLFILLSALFPVGVIIMVHAIETEKSVVR